MVRDKTYGFNISHTLPPQFDLMKWEYEKIMIPCPYEDVKCWPVVRAPFGEILSLLAADTPPVAADEVEE